MEKQTEYELRQKINYMVSGEIDKQLSKYFEKHKDNVGYLIIYPLIFLEEKFNSSFINPASVEPDRVAISWFINKMLQLSNGLINNENFTYKQEEFRDFTIRYQEIRKMYEDSLFAYHITDMYSFGRYIIREKEVNTYVILYPMVNNKYIKESSYYNNLYDEEQLKKEHEVTNQVLTYLIKYYPYYKEIRGPIPIVPIKEHLSLISRLDKDIDKNLLELCKSRVLVDLEKLGSDVRSNTIDNFDDLVKVIGYLYYLGQVRFYNYQAKDSLHKAKKEDFLISYKKEWLIKKINKETNVSEETVSKYIDYFSFKNVVNGTFIEFPLIEIGETLYLIPSSVMLNDWHFSLVNGHYYKRIDFKNREDTVSKSIINLIANKARKYKNISVGTEKYYEILINKEKKINSDIDIALFDSISNCLLVIECKWKSEIYLPEEDSLKLERAVNKIYKTQISKHQEYLSDKKNIKYVIDSEIVDPENIDILYLIVDKRTQLHVDEKHLLPVYLLLTLLEEHSDYDEEDIFSNDKTINFRELFDEIRSFRTETVYEFLLIPKKINIDGKDLLIEGLNLDYSL